MACAFVFPGQGSQAVGMGEELARQFPIVREVFEQVDEAIGEPLSRLCREGPEESLRLTANAQPALMAVSMAVMRILETEGGFDPASQLRFVAGHSLGEYSALAAVGAVSLADTARLLRRRGQAMQEAVPEGEGAMVALLGIDGPRAEEIARAAEKENGSGVCELANDNAPGQVVISGSVKPIEIASRMARQIGARRVIPLSVSAPFHCRLMEPARLVMSTVLEQTKLNPPAVPLIANITARPVEDPQTIRDLLTQQITGRVRWRETIQFIIAQGVDRLIEIGAGQVLTGITRRINRNLKASALNTPADIKKFLKKEA